MRKTTLSRGLLALAMLAATAYSCKKESTTTADHGVSKYQRWYETHTKVKQDFAIFVPDRITVSNEKPAEHPLIPEWDKAATYTTSDSTIFEVPINSEKFGVTQGNLVYEKQTGKPKSFMKLVIFDTPGGVTSAYMTYMPFSAYIAGENAVEKNTYKHQDKDFTGYILFHSLDGKFLKGALYKKGVKVADMGQAAKNKKAGIKTSWEDEEHEDGGGGGGNCWNVTLTWYDYECYGTVNGWDCVFYEAGSSTFDICPDENGGNPIEEEEDECSQDNVANAIDSDGSLFPNITTEGATDETDSASVYKIKKTDYQTVLWQNYLGGEMIGKDKLRERSVDGGWSYRITQITHISTDLGGIIPIAGGSGLEVRFEERPPVGTIFFDNKLANMKYDFTIYSDFYCLGSRLYKDARGTNGGFLATFTHHGH